MGSRKLFALAIALASLAACSDGGITDVSPAANPLMGVHANGGASIDLRGQWTWSDAETLILPAWAMAIAFPTVEAEGPTTHIRCESTGTMTLEQIGNEFSGESVRTTHECVTRGGQVFGGGAAAFLPQPITDGQIRGRSIVMHRFGNNTNCVYHGVISGVQGGTATALNGGAQCIVPGHPKSVLPLDPPPGGVDKVLEWTAVRS